MLTTENQNPVIDWPALPRAVANLSTYSAIAASSALAAICQTVSHKKSSPSTKGCGLVVVGVVAVVDVAFVELEELEIVGLVEPTVVVTLVVVEVVTFNGSTPESPWQADRRTASRSEATTAA